MVGLRGSVELGVEETPKAFGWGQRLRQGIREGDEGRKEQQQRRCHHLTRRVRKQVNLSYDRSRAHHLAHGPGCPQDKP